MSHKFPKFEHIEISGSHTGSTAFSVSTPFDPYLFSIDASSSLDGASRVILRNSNDNLVPYPHHAEPVARGLLHLDLVYTSSQQNKAQDFTIWAYPENYATEVTNHHARIQLHTWTDQYGAGSQILFGSNSPHGHVKNNQLLGVQAYGGYSDNAYYIGGQFKARAERRLPSGDYDPQGGGIDKGWYFSTYNGTTFQYWIVAPDAGAGPYVTPTSSLQERFRMNGWGQFIIWGSASSQANERLLADYYLSSSTAPSLQVFGGSKLGDMTTDTHQVTGSWHMSGTSASFHAEEFRITSTPKYNEVALVIKEYPAPANNRSKFSPVYVFGKDPDTFDASQMWYVQAMEEPVPPWDPVEHGSYEQGFSMWYSGSAAAHAANLHRTTIRYMNYNNGLGAAWTYMQGGNAAASCSWSPEVQQNATRLETSGGEIHWLAYNPYASGGNENNIMLGTSSMILNTSGGLFIGRPYIGQRQDSMDLGKGALYVSGSTKFGTKTTDTHQVTGTLSLSGSSGGAFGTEGAVLDLYGLNSSIRGYAPGGPSGHGHLHMYAEHNLYLGARNTDIIAIGVGNDVLHPTEAPIYIHNTNKTVSLSGSSVQVTGSTILSGSVSFNGYAHLTADAAINPNSTIVGFDTTAGHITGSLFSATAVPIGTIVIFKDETGGAPSMNNILLSASIGETIDGNPTYLLGDESEPHNYGTVSLYSNGSNWFIFSIDGGGG